LFFFVTVNVSAQTYFDNYYKTGFNNLYSCNVITTPDSGCVFVNYIRDSATSRQDVGFIKLDKHGNELIKTSFSLYNLDHLAFLQGMKNFIPATPSSYFLSGGTYTSTSINNWAVITKINRHTLDTIKILLVKDPNYTYATNNIIKLHENKYLLIGNKGNVNSVSPVVLLMDSSLTITNTIIINNVPHGFGCNNAIYNPVNKKILLVGSNSVGQYPNILVHIDTNGVVTHTYSSVSSFTTGFSQVFFSAIDTTYVCIGGRVDSIYGNHPLFKLCICKYDLNLNMLWLKTYGEAALGNSLADAVVTSDGSIVSSGSYSKLTTLPLMNKDQNGVILKVNKDGHFRWMQEYSHQGPGNLDEYFNGIDETKEGGFILCGNVVYMPKAEAWAVKTDGFGCVLSGCISTTVSVDSVDVPPPPPPDTSTVGFNENYIKNLGIKFYPNPFNENLSIDINSEFSHKNNLEFEIQLMTVLGQSSSCDIKKLSNSQFQLNTSKLVPGVFFIKVFYNGQLIKTLKGVKE
jgi:hypothetical protein